MSWDLVYNHLNDNSNYLVNHHLDSFNNFIDEKLPQTFQQYNPQIIYKEFNKETKSYKYVTKIYYGGKDGSKVYLAKPIAVKNEENSVLYPNEARLRDLTYASNIFCDITIEYNVDGTTYEKEFEKVEMGRMPIMLQSKLCALGGATPELKRLMGECPYDQGGYFIVDGAEKVMVSVERKTENKLYIVESNNNLSAQIKSTPNESFKYARTTTVFIEDTSGKIYVKLPMIPKKLPLCVVFRALGVLSDKEIMEYIFYNLDSQKAKLMMEHLRSSVEESCYIIDQNDALKFLSMMTQGKTLSHLLDNLNTDLFPHVGDDYMNKAYYLGYVVQKLLEVKLGLKDTTDRDSFSFKRVDLSGFLLANLFRESYKQLQRDIKIAIDSEYRFNGNEYQESKFANIINEGNFTKIFNPKVITDGFLKSFKIGNVLNKKGVIQAINRLSWPGTMSHLRRINTLGDMIMIGQRKLHSTQYGMICPAETPDGGNIGIKKHLSVLCRVSFGTPGDGILECLVDLGLKPLNGIIPPYINHKMKIFVNGKWVGVHEDPLTLFETLKVYKRNALINVFTSIYLNYKELELHILTDNGRLCRPVLVVENGTLLMDTKKNVKELSWNQQVGGTYLENVDFYDKNYYKTKSSLEELKKTQGFIEYLDVDEFDGSLLANTKDDITSKTTHMEIHPSLILGFLGFNLPYCNSSQAPRNVYGTGQTKQSVGMFASNFRNRMDKTANVLSYPQKALVSTKLSDFSLSNQLPTGMNAIVAIACYSGYNQEDSIIVNKSAVERGLFNGFTFKTKDTYEMYDAKENIEHKIGLIADDEKKKKEYNYDLLGPDGVIPEGTYVKGGDVLISKYIINDDDIFDDSIAVKDDLEGVVDKVFMDTMNTSGNRICKVRISNGRNPKLGDKFASRHGQKGTVGMLLRQEDMPFSKDGIVPDIIVNPHAIPSRMTLGQFIEVIQGKVCTNMGFYADATPFNHLNSEDVSDILEQTCDMERHGNEILYSGILGNQLDTKIFIGPTYYQRLKHMTQDKVNSRNTGKYTLKTQQPPSGRSIGGGLRIGEMERDAILSHGMSGFLKESMYERSDKYECHISDYSGLISIANPGKNRFIDPLTDGPLEYDINNELINYNSNDAQILPVKMPFNMKMLMQECESMGIAMRLVLDGEKEFIDIDKKVKAFKPQIKDKQSKRSKKLNVDAIKLPTIDSNTITINYLKSKLDVELTTFETKEVLEKISNAGYDSKIRLSDYLEDGKLLIKKINEETFKFTIEDNVEEFVPGYNNQDDLDGMETETRLDLTSLIKTNLPSYAYYQPVSPDYMPQSPDYMPQSPDYMPQSPEYVPQSPEYVPKSPEYVPKSPEYAPQSPPYMPQSPENDDDEIKTIKIDALPSSEDTKTIKLDTKDVKDVETFYPKEDYAPLSPDYHPDGTYGKEPDGERTKLYEIDPENSTTKIITLETPQQLPDIDSLEPKVNSLEESDFGGLLEEVDLKLDDLPTID